MRSGAWRLHNAQVGAASGQDGVDFVGCSEIAADQRWDTGFVAHPVAHGRQEAAPVGHFSVWNRLARQRFDHITTVRFEHPGNFYRTLDRETTLDAISHGERNRERLFLRP